MLLIKAILFENFKHLGFLASDHSLANAPEQILQACEKTVRQSDLLGIGSSDSIFIVPLQPLVPVTVNPCPKSCTASQHISSTVK